MKSYSHITEHGVHPEDNRVHVPEGWNGILYCDDPNEEDAPVKVDSLPEPGSLIVGVFNDYTEDFYHMRARREAAEKKGDVYCPEYTKLLHYVGLDRQNFPIFYPLVEETGTLIGHKDYKVFRPVQQVVVAWKLFPKLPQLEVTIHA